MDPAQRMSWTIVNELILLKEVISEDSYSNHERWKEIHLNVVKHTGKEFSYRACREHIARLLKLVKKDDTINLRKSPSTSSSDRSDSDCSDLTYMSTGKTEWKYKKRKTFQARREESKEIFRQYPNSIPVILEKLPNAASPSSQKEKYLIPRDLSVTEFSLMVQRNMFVTADTAVHLIADDELLLSNKKMGEVYDQEKDKDGFLYLNYSAYKPFSYSKISDGRIL